MKRRKMFAKLGFTLAELMIVIALLAVVATVAVPSVAKYTKSISLRELDDSARAIYMAAQHEFKSKIAAGESLEVADTATLSTPKRYTGDGTITPVDHISYAIFSGKLATGELINVGAIEPELTENCFVIEYNADSGDVYGVFYSTDPEEFTDYKTAYNDDGGKYAAAVEKSSDRVSTLGYYGLENAPATAPPTPADIPAPSVKIINKEKLVLEVTAPAVTVKDNKIYTAVKINGVVDIVPRDNIHYLAPNGSFTVVLDTLGSENYALTEALESSNLERSFSSWITGHESEIAPGAELNIAVTFYDPEGMAIDQTVTVKANSLFADGSDTETAHIQYGRHLQNLTNCNTVKNVFIDKTIDFSNDSGDYEGWANENVYKNLKFETIARKENISISASAGVQIRYLNAEGGGIFAELDGAEVSGLTIVNATVEGDKSGAIAASASGGSFTDCRAYVEALNGEVWNNPEIKDPFEAYTVTGESAAGGLVGKAENVNFDKCYASVKVKATASGSFAGGLIGKAGGENLTVTDCFVGGHTEGGQFTENRRDNVSGATAGGLIGSASDTVTLSETVFTTCSVKGEAAANPICPDADKITISDPVNDCVYTLGKAFLGDAETVFAMPTNAKDASEATAEKPGFGKRYDNSVGSTFKHKVPGGMTMHGDWTTAETVSGFFYWEIEEGIYHVFVPGMVENDLCPNRDGKKITAYGYGAFSGDSLGKVTFKQGENPVEAEVSTDSGDIDGVAAVLNAKGVNVDKAKVNLYNFKGDITGFVTATVGGKTYSFAPDFYAICEGETAPGVYEVRCEEHLKNIVNYVDDITVKFVQSHDITPGVIKPIGDDGSPFKGSYDGGCYRIIDAQFEVADGGYAGLFGVTEGAEIKDVVLFNRAATASDFKSLAVWEEPVAASISALNGGEVLAAVSGQNYTATVTTRLVEGWIFEPWDEKPRLTYEIFAPGTEQAKRFIETFKKGCITEQDTIEMVSNVSHGSNPAINLVLGEKDVNIFNNCVAQINEGHMTFKLYSWMSYNLTFDDNKAGVYIVGAFSEAPTLTIEFPDTEGESGVTPPAPACDHVYDGWTSISDTDHQGTCSKCGDIITESHESDGNWLSNAENHWHKCSKCGGEYGRTAHEPGEWKDLGNDNHEQQCKVCNYAISSAAPHNFGTDNSEEYCMDCGAPNPDVKHYAPSTPAVAGGIVGKATGGSIENCVVAGYTVTGSSAAGGIVGESSGTAITNCEANVKLSGDGSVGGIAGSTNAAINGCYALIHGYSGKATNTLGGIAGKTTVTVKVENCYVIFAGQTAGYPVADRNMTNTETCYYVNEEGFCSVSGDIVNSAKGVTLEDLKKITPLDSFELNPVTYVDSASPSEGVYQYPAIFKAESVVEHYGPEVVKTTKAPGGKVVTGPLVGVFNLFEYADDHKVGGLLSYNRDGILYMHDQETDGSTVTDNRRIGVVIEKEFFKKISEEDGRLDDPYDLQDLLDGTEKHGQIEIWVNDMQIHTVILANDLDYRDGNVFGTSSGETLVGIKDGSLQSAGQGNRFNGDAGDYDCTIYYYYLCDNDGNKLELSDYIEKTITVYYTNPYGERGILIKSDWNNGAVNNKNLKGELVPAGYEFDDKGAAMDTPAVGAFKAGYNNWSGLGVFGIAGGKSFGKLGIINALKEYFNIGVFIAGDKVKDYEDGKLRVLFNGNEIDLIPWKEASCLSSPVANQDELDSANINKYSAYIIKDRNVVSSFQWLGYLRFDFVYGTNFYCSVSLEDNNWKMIGDGMCPLPEEGKYGFNSSGIEAESITP